MTTTVKVLIEGNKACEVNVVDPAAQALNNGPGSIKAMDTNIPTKVLPGSFTTKQIHGKQYVTVTEVGDFIS